MTNLLALKQQLSESKLDVLTAKQMFAIKGGCGGTVMGGSKKKSFKKSHKSGRSGRRGKRGTNSLIYFA